MAPKTVAEYLELPCTGEVIRNEDGFFARVEELPGCMTWTGRSDDLWPMVHDARRAWIEDALEDGDPVPEPDRADRETDRMVVRLPDEVHRKLRRRASENGVSVDQLVTATLAHAVGE